MSKEIIRRKAQGVISNIGRAGLHALAPDDFEYYACTFELINYFGETEDIFHFPVMPNGIQIGRQSLVSIKKTGQGYLSQFSNSFAGRSISLSGTFGRKFRLLINNIGGKNLASGGLQQFDLNVKTGYGALKLLERLVERSFELDPVYKMPRRLIFHNYTLNHNHVVEIINFQQSQSLENNMIWNYTLEMKMLADIKEWQNANSKKGHLKDLLAMAALNKSINNILDNVTINSAIK